MNFRKLLIVIILLSLLLFFILGSYLAADSAANLLRLGPSSFEWKLGRAKVWPIIQNFTWNVTDPSQGDRESMPDKILEQGDNSSEAVSQQVSRKAQITGATNQIKDVNMPQQPHESKHSSLKMLNKASLRDPIKRILSNIDHEVRVQYFLQAKKYESQHSKPINQLDLALQWDFLVKFLEAAGYGQKFPNFINIGVKKSGTNAFGFFISQHPLVSHSIGNEVHFFDWNYEKGLDFYKSKMGFSTKRQLSFEKTPRYFVTDSAPGNILKDLGNDTKFILCVRDPITRLISDFRHERELSLRRTWIKNGKKPFATNAEGEGKKLASLIIDKEGNINSSSDIVRTSSYSIHLKNWLKFYPLSNFLFLNHDDLIGNTFKVMKKAEKFLNLDDYFTRHMFYFDPARGGPCIYHMERSCPARSTPGFLPKAKLSKNVEYKLKQYFHPIITDFFDIIGEEFAWSKEYRQ